MNPGTMYLPVTSITVAPAGVIVALRAPTLAMRPSVTITSASRSTSVPRIVITVAPRSTMVPVVVARGSDTSKVRGVAAGVAGTGSGAPSVGAAAVGRGAGPVMRTGPPLAATSARLASGGSAPGGTMSVARSGEVLAMIVRPSGVQVGSAHHAGAVVRRTGASRPSARAFQRAPPDSSHVTKATQRLSGDQAGMNSRARAVVVRRRGAPVASAIQMRPSDENATCPLGAVVCCCTRRVRTGPVASRCGKRSVGVTSNATSTEKGITVSLPSCTPRRWSFPPKAAYSQRPSGEKAALGSTSREARASSWLRSTGYASHRSAPVASVRSRRPVFPSRTVPYTSVLPSGESMGFMAGRPSTTTGSAAPPLAGTRMSALVAPLRLPYGRGVTAVNHRLAPSGDGHTLYGPGAGAETSGCAGPLPLGTSRVP